MKTTSSGPALGRALVVSVLIAVLIGTASASTTRPKSERGPFLVVSLPALGSVTWRCDASRRPGVARDLPAMALGFRVFEDSATTVVRLHVRKRTIVQSSVHPGRSIRFPYVRSRLQQLDLVQATGAGTLRAFVSVDFVPGGGSKYCYDYLPPRVTVHVYPRV